MYVFEPEIFELIPRNTFYLFGKQVFPLLLEQRKPLYGHLTAAYWKDVGNLKIYQQTHTDMLAGKVNVKLPFNELRKYVWVGENVQIDPTAEIGYPVAIGDNVVISAGARILENTVIGNNCRVEAGASVHNSILWDGSVIMSGTHLERCVIGRDCHVQTNAAIFDGIIVSPLRAENGCK